MFKNLRWTLGGAVLAICLNACGRDAPTSAMAPQQQEQAVWTNNGYESDAIGATPSGWTLTTYLNSTGLSGSAAAPPSSVSMLNLGSAGAGVSETLVVGGANMSQSDPDLGTAQAFRFPRFGVRSARINYLGTGNNNGKNKNANMLRQTMTLSQADTDPTDGQVHVRVVLAPVLENPAHGFSQQPYFYVELFNVTRNASLYQGFNIAGQQSAPWNNTTSTATHNPTQWLDWQMLDILASPDTVSVGEQVMLTVVASGCQPGGHFGRVYLDGAGASVPGPYTWATVARLAHGGDNLTYTVNYSNGGTTAGVGASINFDVPANTTFLSTSLGSCTTPSVGGTGTLSCPLGTLSPGAVGAFTVTVAIPAAATAPIHSGTYSINAVNASRLLGPGVTTTLVPSSSALADVAVTPVTSANTANWGAPFSYAFQVTNNGSAALAYGQVSVTDTPPSQFTNVSWTCALTSGSSSTSSCGSSSGTGNIATRPMLAANAAVTYTVSGTVATGSGSATVSHTPAASVVSGVSDPNTYNNTTQMVTVLGTPSSLSVTKTQPTYGKITTYPSILACDTGCVSASGSTADGTSVQINAIAQNGGSFTGWGGACSGTATACSVTLNGNQAVYANFAAPPAVGPAATVYVYAGNSQYASVSTAYAKPVQAFVADTNGTPVPNVAVTFSVPGTGASATVAPLTVNTNAYGIASATATANGNVGAFNVTATAAGVATPVTFGLTNVGIPNTINYVVGGDTTTAQVTVVNSNFNTAPTVRVLDAAGNPVPGITVNFAAAGSTANATLSSPTAVTDAQGYASINAQANGTAGNFDLNATTTITGGATGTVTFKLSNTAATATSLNIVSGTPQTTDTNAAFNLPLLVSAVNNVGNPVPGVTVTFAATGTSANATLSATTVTTDINGQASITATANGTAGSYTVTATTSGVPSVSFALTNDGTQYVTVQSGGGQSTAVGSAYANPLVALVTDRSGNPVSGAVVTFTAPTSGALATFGGASSVTATTNGAGLATAAAPTAGSAAGSFNINATTAASTAAASFAMTNKAGAASSVVLSSGTPQSAAAGAAFGAPLVARVNDASGNPGVRGHGHLCGAVHRRHRRAVQHHGGHQFLRPGQHHRHGRQRGLHHGV